VTNRKRQLTFILVVVVAFCSAVSHLAIYWLKIRALPVGYHHYGLKGERADTVLFGSSLAYDGLDWWRISKAQGEAIESWATAGSSPTEWEVHQKRSLNASRTVVVVSAYDLNEYWLCDFRADIVPLRVTFQDLWQCGVDWQFRKRILSQYVTMFVRKVFPTVGRSDGVMTGVREKLEQIVGGAAHTEEGEGPKFGAYDNTQSKDKVTDWSPGHLLRRLALMRTACQGKHSFSGPKKLALERLLQQGGRQGEVTLVVMPVSPIYRKEFLSPRVLREFEGELDEMQQRCPQTRLIRLDQIPALQDNNMFRDFVHLNIFGDQIATAVFLDESKRRWSRR
jgi:hypothetical protein